MTFFKQPPPPTAHIRHRSRYLKTIAIKCNKDLSEVPIVAKVYKKEAAKLALRVARRHGIAIKPNTRVADLLEHSPENSPIRQEAFSEVAEMLLSLEQFKFLRR